MGLIKFFSEARVAVATIFLSITLVCILAGKFFLAVFLAALTYLGTKELVNMAKAKSLNPCFTTIIAVDFLLLIVAAMEKLPLLDIVLTFGIISSCLVILFRGKRAKVTDLSSTIFCIMYGGWLPMHLMLLRNLNHNGLNLFNWHVREGLGYFILIFFVITLSDISAFYIGKRFGKRPLWTEISPKKTVEGAIGGTLGGLFGSVLIGSLIGLPLIHCVIAGIVLSLSAQFGDLTESMIKRDAGFKDSGNLLPGHGGFLDRADSYIFTGAVAYYYFKIFVIGSSVVACLRF